MFCDSIESVFSRATASRTAFTCLLVVVFAGASVSAAAVGFGKGGLPRPLSYSADGKIYVLDRNGRQRALTDSTRELFGFAWSPDGTKLAALWGESGLRTPTLVVVDARGQIGSPIS